MLKNNPRTTEMPVPVVIRQGYSLTNVLSILIMDQLVSHVRAPHPSIHYSTFSEIDLLYYAGDAVIISGKKTLYSFCTMAKTIKSISTIEKETTT